MKPHLKFANEAQSVAPQHLAHLDAIGAVICDYALHDIVGVALLHKHFDLSERERLVSRHRESVWATEPAEFDDSEICPCAWAIDVSSPKADWIPVEFFSREASLDLKVRAAELVLGDQGFLDAIHRELSSKGLADIFGIALLADTTKAIPNEHSWFEISDEVSRQTILVPVPTHKLSSSGGVTVWRFYAGSRQTASNAYCYHGGSQHCCGLGKNARAILDQLGVVAPKFFGKPVLAEQQ